MADVVALQERLEKAKENLHSVDENIRKLTGRDPGERRVPGPGAGDRDQRRVSLGNQGPRGRGRGRGGGVQRADAFQRLGVPIARRQSTGSAFSRLGGRVDGPQPKRPRDRIIDDDDDLPKHTIQSSVVATPKVVRTRQDSIEEQSKDVQGQKRNRRMFGHLLGTLQKFKEESNDMESKERRRSEIEKKLEEQALEEQRAVAAQRSQLFQERRSQQFELQKLERLVDIAKEQDVWDAHTKKLSNFIRTKAKPPLFYRPAKPSLVTEKKLRDSKELLNDMMRKRRAKIEAEIQEMQTETSRKPAEQEASEASKATTEATTEVKGKTRDKKKRSSKGKHEECRNGKHVEEASAIPDSEEDMEEGEAEKDGGPPGTAAAAAADEGWAAGEGEAGKDGAGKQGSASPWEEEEGEWQDRTVKEAVPEVLPEDPVTKEDKDDGKENLGEVAVEEDFRTALYQEDDLKQELSWEEEPMDQ